MAFKSSRKDGKKTVIKVNRPRLVESRSLLRPTLNPRSALATGDPADPRVGTSDAVCAGLHPGETDAILLQARDATGGFRIVGAGYRRRYGPYKWLEVAATDIQKALFGGVMESPLGNNALRAGEWVDVPVPGHPHVVLRIRIEQNGTLHVVNPDGGELSLYKRHEGEQAGWYVRPRYAGESFYASAGALVLSADGRPPRSDYQQVPVHGNGKKSDFTPANMDWGAPAHVRGGFSEVQVVRILRAVSINGESRGSVAQSMGVRRSVVDKILQGESYRTPNIDAERRRLGLRVCGVTERDERRPAPPRPDGARDTLR